MATEIFFTTDEKKELFSLYRKLLKLSGDTLQKDDCKKLKTHLINAIQQNFIQRDIFGLNPIIKDMQTAVITAEEIIGTVKRILSAGIPIMGHLGLMPQSINKYGTYTVRAKDEAEAEKLVRDAHLLEEAGCFAIVLEKIPAVLAERVARELTIPVIGIGAGGGVDGQVLVVQDMLGMNNGFRPRFLRRYADLHTVMTDAISCYVSDVKNLDFPNEKEQY